MKEIPLSYQVYIIRSWEEQGHQDGQPVVRFMLEFVETGQRRGFTSRQALLEAIASELSPDKRIKADSIKFELE